MKALIVSADGFEDSELFAPYCRLLEEEIITEIASRHAGHIVGKASAWKPSDLPAFMREIMKKCRR